MKKRMIAALAGLMVLALGSMTALASVSSETDTQKQNVKEDAEKIQETTIESADDTFSDLSVVVDTSGAAPSTIQTEGATIIVSLVQADAGSNLSASEIIAQAEAQALAQARANVSTLLGNLGARQQVRTEKIASFSVTAANLSPAQSEALDKGTANINLTFTVSDIVADGSYVVTHLCSAHDQWETVPVVKVENGKITLNFHSFSPVVISKVEAVDDENLGEGAGEGNGSTLTAGVTSPKTGETVPFAAVLSVALFAGAAVCAAKRVKFN
jgi:hypothetical protein